MSVKVVTKAWDGCDAGMPMRWGSTRWRSEADAVAYVERTFGEAAKPPSVIACTNCGFWHRTGPLKIQR